LIWGAAWLYKATNTAKYWDFVKSNIQTLGANFFDFGWSAKQAGINVLVSQVSLGFRSREIHVTFDSGF